MSVSLHFLLMCLFIFRIVDKCIYELDGIFYDCAWDYAYKLFYKHANRELF
jgi:hypothetical protein